MATVCTLGYETYLYGGSLSFGLNPVLANLDDDDAVEMTNGRFVWEWSGGAWVQEPTFPGANASGVGFAAVADFGPYGASLTAGSPEIAVVQGSNVVIHAMDGALAYGPVAVPGSGGGNPTVADYDGDGMPEVGVAGLDFYSVFDPDCTATPRAGGTCETGSQCDDAAGVAGPCPPGVLWSRKTQDHSSQLTGSSVFDFEADGNAEAIYADECFARVYRGTDGEVLFSQYTSSCTWYENPVVADVDGNFRADLVVPSNRACSDGVNGINCAGSLDAQGVDKQFAGLRCQEAEDCVSGVCTAGFCRCATTAECCAAQDETLCGDAGFKCAVPPESVGGDNTCRASHPRGLSGIRVYSDARDRWVRSRTIWNQHAYAVTHENEDGTVCLGRDEVVVRGGQVRKRPFPKATRDAPVPDLPPPAERDRGSCLPSKLAVGHSRHGVFRNPVGIGRDQLLDGPKRCRWCHAGRGNGGEQPISGPWTRPCICRSTSMVFRSSSMDTLGANRVVPSASMGAWRGTRALAASMRQPAAGLRAPAASMRRPSSPGRRGPSSVRRSWTRPAHPFRGLQRGRLKTV